MFLINENFLNKLLANLVNKDKNSIMLNMNDLNSKLELRKSLLETLNTHILIPLSNLDYTLPLDEILGLIDLYVDEYILESQDIVEKYLDEYYWTGVQDALDDLSHVIKEQDLNYTPQVIQEPENLHFLVDMLQRNLEDYGLVLRGRLRSKIEVKYWRAKAYGN